MTPEFKKRPTKASLKRKPLVPKEVQNGSPTSMGNARLTDKERKALLKKIRPKIQGLLKSNPKDPSKAIDLVLKHSTDPELFIKLLGVCEDFYSERGLDQILAELVSSAVQRCSDRNSTDSSQVDESMMTGAAT